jgi:hypothetical protein
MSLLKLLFRLNKVLMFFIVVIWFCFLWTFFDSKEEEESPYSTSIDDHFLDTTPLSFNESFYLKSVPMDINVSELNKELIFLGVNTRPDCDFLSFNFSMKGLTPFVCYSEDVFYLTLNKEKSNQLILSKDSKGALIELWDCQLNGGKAVIQAKLYGEFTPPIEIELMEQPFRKHTLEYEGLFVDTQMLARQNITWLGNDSFLQEHGGIRFNSLALKERIDFENGLYTHFLSPSEGLIWKGGRWIEVSLGVDSRNYPLLYLKEVDERGIHFEFWDLQGLSKIELVLVKSAEVTTPPQRHHRLRLLSVRSLKKCLLEIEGSRCSVHPKDWLLLQDKGWQYLSSSAEIERYVLNELKGELLVIDQVVRRGGRYLLLAHIFNQSRAIKEMIEIDLETSREYSKGELLKPVNGLLTQQ